MSDDINRIDFKQLRNEVQLLRDELAIMKRKYEDIIYNLDTDNFSSRFVKEQGDMKTAIKVTAEEIETKVSNEEFQSAQTQTAEKIESEVKKLDGKFENYSTIEQTADAIKSQAYASADLSSATQITDLTQATNQTKTYYIEDGDGNKTYYYYNTISKEWEEIVGGGIETVFEQTATGFKLKGNVQVDGSCILTNSLTFDSSDNPLQVEYSVDGTNNWHSTFVSGSDKFMRLKIGAKWSDAMKIVGTDGQPGAPGSDATVSKRDVFDMLTAGGTTQGLFPVFYDGGDKLFINAEYIQAGQLSADYIDTENLSCTSLYAKGNYNGYSVRLNGNMGDFGIFNGNEGANSSAKDGDCMFGVYNTFPNVNFYIYGNNFLGYDSNNLKVWAKGDWDFSACTSVDFGDFVSSGGGTVVAVFG